MALKQFSNYIDNIVVYYSETKKDLIIGYAKKTVRYEKTDVVGLLVEDYITGKEIVLVKTPTILSKEIYFLQNKMKFRLFFLLKMLGFHKVDAQFVQVDKALKQYILPECVEELENHFIRNDIKRASRLDSVLIDIVL